MAANGCIYESYQMMIVFLWAVSPSPFYSAPWAMSHRPFIHTLKNRTLYSYPKNTCCYRPHSPTLSFGLWEHRQRGGLRTTRSIKY